MTTDVSSPDVIHLRTRTRPSPDIVGGKGWGLLALSRIRGIRVPPAFILTTAFFERFVTAAGLAGAVAEWRNSLGRKQFGPGERLGKRIRRRIAELDGLPAELGRVLARAIGNWRVRVPWIVRSSATHEDTRRASAAGKYASVPAVSGRRGLELAVLKVWGSLFVGGHTTVDAVEGEGAAGADGAAAKVGVPALSAPRPTPAMAIVVQEMIPASAAGVACHGRLPDGSEGVLVEAVAGLGETLCSGRVTPSRWIFDTDADSLLERTVCPQLSQLVLVPGCGQVVQSIPSSRQCRSPISISLAREVAREVKRIAGVLCFHLEAEFCFDRNGILHMVQCRPQTGSSTPATRAPARPESWEPAGRRRMDLNGTCASPGVANGRLLLIDAGDSRNPEGSNLPIARRFMRPGDLLVTPTVNIGWTEWFPQLAGVITERGGVLSHTATLARECGIPAVVGAARCIRRLKALLQPRIRQLAPGAWMARRVTFDAEQGLVLDGPLSLGRVTAAPCGRTAPTGEPRRRVEWPHFVDAEGRDWTGKPEYPLCPLQFDLYHEAWRIAFHRMKLSRAEIPLLVSVVTPDHTVKAGRRMGRIKPGAALPSTAAEYRVVAFPTATLSAIGDRMLHGGGGGSGIPPLARRLHRERRAAFRRWADLAAQLAREGDAFRAYDRLFCAYSTAIAFAHLRATFRRRVAGPLLDQAMASLPKSIGGKVRTALLHAARGLRTRTSQARARTIRGLLRWAGRPEIRPELERRSPDEAEKWLEWAAPVLHARLVRCAESYKLDRAQSDVMQVGPPLAGWIKMIQEYLAAPPVAIRRPLRSRTWEGFQTAVERLKEPLLRASPGFDCQSFKEIILMCWEVPGMTEYERHFQHRMQHTLRKALLRIEAKLHCTRQLRPRRSIFDCGRRELLRLMACLWGGACRPMRRQICR